MRQQTKKQETRKLLVYGTLRKGFGLHFLLEGQCKFRGIAKIKGYKMFTEGSIPFIIKEEGGVVVGEIYEFTGDLETIKRIFRNLDFIEEGYSRERVQAKLVGTKKKIEVECYIFNQPSTLLREYKKGQIDLVESGDWKGLKEKGAMKEEMYCAVEGCGRVDKSHTAYCSKHGRSIHDMRLVNKTLNPVSIPQFLKVCNCQYPELSEKETEDEFIVKCEVCGATKTTKRKVGFV